MGQFGSGGVLLAAAGTSELLGDDQLADVNPSAEQIRDGLFGIGQCVLGGPGNEGNNDAVELVWE